MPCSKREIVFGDMAKPHSASKSAILPVVRRHHFRSVIGSPAMSCRRRYSMVEIISGVFFPSERVRHPVVAVEQLLTATGYCMSIQIEQVRQKGVTAAAKFDGFQTGVKAPLLLVQEAVEQQDRSFHFIG